MTDKHFKQLKNLLRNAKNIADVQEYPSGRADRRCRPLGKDPNDALPRPNTGGRETLGIDDAQSRAKKARAKV